MHLQEPALEKISMSKKRIAVISEDLAEPWDEGIKKFTFCLAGALQSLGEVLLLNVDRSNLGGQAAVRIPGTRTFFSMKLKHKLGDFDPDIIIYVPSPSSTLASFIRCAALRVLCPRALLGMVAMIPRRHHPLWNFFLRTAAPHKIYVPSYASLLYFKLRSLPGEIIRPGVDTYEFHPPSREEKSCLREKYDFNNASYIFLHVGHLSPKRGLEKLAVLAGIPGCEVLVVGSTSTKQDRDLRNKLESQKIRIICDYVPIDEIFRLADCYVFPVESEEGCIELPLSVLEALASGIPVLSYPFGGLKDFLAEGPDLIYFSDVAEMRKKALELIKSPRHATRDMGAFSWRRVAEEVLEKLGG